MTSAARKLVAGAERIAPAEPVPVPPLRTVAPGTVIQIELGMLGQATSDGGVLVLEAIAAVQGPRVAADAAAGYADAYARFFVSNPEAFQ